MMLTSVAAIGYALVGALFSMLAVLLAASWRGNRIGIYLILACLINAAWGFVQFWSVARTPIEPLVIFLLEVLRPTAWVLFLVFLVAEIGVGRIVRGASVLVCVAVLIAGLAVPVLEPDVIQSIDLGNILFPGGLAIALTGLLLIEQLYRNSPPEVRWGLKALIIGVGGIFAFDLFLYSQAVLFNAVDLTTWAARGVINVFFVPAIAIAARRNPNWELRIFVSRQVVFYSTTLVAVGAYLLAMSLGGYLLIQFGGSWGALAQIVFFVGAILVLLVLLFSSTMRLRLRVFLSKHFFHNKYDYREEWMRLIGTLSEFEQSSTREVAVKALAQIAGSSSGVLWVYRDKEKKYVVDARYEYARAVPDIFADDRLVGFIRKDNWLVDLAEFAEEPDRYDGLALPDWVQSLTGAWLFVPVVLGQELLGLIMLTRAPGPPKLNYEDRDLLKTAGNHVAIHIAQARSERLLTEAQQFETYNKLTAFLMHDLNNLIAQQSLIVTNAKEHKRNPDFVDDTVSTIASSVERMKSVMRKLKRGNVGGGVRETELRFVVSAAIDECSVQRPEPELNLDGQETIVSVDADELKMVLVHLIRNAQDATGENGNVNVDLRNDGDRAQISIVDDGVGMTEEFLRDRLFRPFDSTKGNQGMGIGAYQASEFVRQIGGNMSVESEVGQGTRITILLDLK